MKSYHKKNINENFVLEIILQYLKQVHYQRNTRCIIALFHVFLLVLTIWMIAVNILQYYELEIEKISYWVIIPILGILTTIFFRHKNKWTNWSAAYYLDICYHFQDRVSSCYSMLIQKKDISPCLLKDTLFHIETLPQKLPNLFVPKYQWISGKITVILLLSLTVLIIWTFWPEYKSPEERAWEQAIQINLNHASMLLMSEDSAIAKEIQKITENVSSKKQVYQSIQNLKKIIAILQKEKNSLDRKKLDRQTFNVQLSSEETSKEKDFTNKNNNIHHNNFSRLLNDSMKDSELVPSNHFSLKKEKSLQILQQTWKSWQEKQTNKIPSSNTNFSSNSDDFAQQESSILQSILDNFSHNNNFSQLDFEDKLEIQNSTSSFIWSRENTSYLQETWQKAWWPDEYNPTIQKYFQQISSQP